MIEKLRTGLVFVWLALFCLGITACAGEPGQDELLPTPTIEILLPTVYIPPTQTSTLSPTLTHPPEPTTEPAEASPALVETLAPDSVVQDSESISPESLTKGNWVTLSYGEKQNRRDIYLLNLLTGQFTNLTNNRGGNLAPVFLPDGGSIIYVGCRPDCDLYQMDLNNQREIRLSDLSYKVMFPDMCMKTGKPWVAFEGRQDNDETNIWMLDLLTDQTRQLTFGKRDYRPAWSPDCSKVLFERINARYDYGDIFALELATGEEEQLTFTPNADELNFAWSPDGKWIVFTRVSGDTNRDGFYNLDDRADLYLMRPDGSDQYQLAVNGLSVFSPSWSPDSQKILFIADYANINQGDLWIFHLGTGELEQLTGMDDYFHPRWSP